MKNCHQYNYVKCCVFWDVSCSKLLIDRKPHKTEIEILAMLGTLNRVWKKKHRSGTIRLVQYPLSPPLPSRVIRGCKWGARLGTNEREFWSKMANSKRSLYGPAPSQTPPPQIRYCLPLWKFLLCPLFPKFSIWHADMHCVLRKSLAQGVLVAEPSVGFASASPTTT